MGKEAETELGVTQQVSNMAQPISHLPMDPAEYAAVEKRLVRRIDTRLLPVLIVMIVLNYLDRNALPNARLQHIEKDLGLVGEQYNTCISVLFAGYIALQIPSNLILTRVRPSIYLPTCMALWGIVSACTAATKDFKGLVVCRFFLGFLEAPFFPGALFLLSSWYTPRELATRTAIMYCGSLLSSAFGGLVGAGVQHGLNGTRGLHPWQWLFIIEGAVTVAFSLLSLMILPDFPATTRWLTEQEKAVAVHRLRVHSGSVDEERGSVFKGLLMALSDYKVWMLALIAILKTSAGAVTAFIPTLVATFGFGKTQSLLMTAPPYVLAAFVSLGVSISSDKREERYFHLVSPLLFGVVGFIIAAATTSLAPRYFALFLMLGGVYGSFDITYAWISSTLPRPLEKRAAAFAIANMVGNFAQIYSPYMYNASLYAPRYIPAMAANTGFVTVCIITATVLRFCLKRENAKLAAIEEASQHDGTGYDPKHGDEIIQSGPGGTLVLTHGFRYVL